MIGDLEKKFAECSTEDSHSDQEEEFSDNPEKGPLPNKSINCEIVCEREITKNKHIYTPKVESNKE